jgi:hypothetical protein
MANATQTQAQIRTFLKLVDEHERVENIYLEDGILVQAPGLSVLVLPDGSTVDQPFYAIVEGRDGFHVEPFRYEKHIGRFGFLLPGITLFRDREEVAHLRDQILN